MHFQSMDWLKTWIVQEVCTSILPFWQERYSFALWLTYSYMLGRSLQQWISFEAGQMLRWGSWWKRLKNFEIKESKKSWLASEDAKSNSYFVLENEKALRIQKADYSGGCLVWNHNVEFGSVVLLADDLVAPSVSLCQAALPSKHSSSHKFHCTSTMHIHL